MSEEEQLDEMVDEMFESYCEGGFDFDTDQSLNDIFKMIFNDAVRMTLSVLESQEEEEHEETA